MSIHENLQPTSSDFNDQDGKRRWHERVSALTSYESETGGAVVWIGSAKNIRDLPAPAFAIKGAVVDRFYSRVRKPGFLFANWEGMVTRSDNGHLTHIPPERVLDFSTSYRGILSINESERVKWIQKLGCGQYWVGIASFPLPQDWDKPDSFWPGWTHVFHTNVVAQVTKAFDFVTAVVRQTEIYPKNLKQVTRELGVQLGIDVNVRGNFERDYLYWQLPWLNPRLSHHPVTGEVLT